MNGRNLLEQMMEIGTLLIDVEVSEANERKFKRAYSHMLQNERKRSKALAIAERKHGAANVWKEHSARRESDHELYAERFSKVFPYESFP